MKLLLYLSICVAVSAADNSTIRLRITRKGFDYVNRLARLLEGAVHDTQVPDFSEEYEGDGGKFTLSLSNSTISKFQMGVSTYKLIKPNSIEWAVDGVEAKISSRYNLSYGSDHLTFDGSGATQFVIKNASFSVTLSSLSNHKSFSIKLDGDTSWDGLRYIHPILKDTAKMVPLDNMKNLIYSLADDMLSRVTRPDAEVFDFLQNTTAAGLLDVFRNITLEVNEDLAVTDNYADFNFGAKASYGDIPIDKDPQALPESDESDHMIYAWVGDHLMNSALQTAHKMGVLRAVVNKDSVPPGRAKELRTTCPGERCIGTALSTIAKTYPNRYVEIALESQESPVYETIAGMEGPKITTNFSAVISVKNGTESEKVASMDVIFKAYSNISVACKKYSVQFASLYVNLEREVSHVGDFNSIEFFALSVGLQDKVTRLVKHLVLKNAPMPELFKCENLKMQMVAGAMQFYSDMN